MPASHVSDKPVARSNYLAVAGLLAAAGGLHLAALPGHLNGSTATGAFFVVMAAAQLLGAMVVATRPSSRTLLAVIAGNVAVLALWAISRTTGLPTGGELGAREPVGLLDGMAAAAEIIVVLGSLATMVRRVEGTGRRSGGRRPALVLLVTWLISGGAGLAVADVGHHGGAGHTHSGPTSAGHSGRELDRSQPVSAEAPVGSGRRHDPLVPGRSVSETGCPAGHDCTGHPH